MQTIARYGHSFSIFDKVKSHVFPNTCTSIDTSNNNLLQQLKTNEEIDAIVNLAAEHRDDVRPKSLYDDANPEGAKNICDFARKQNITKIFFTSSVAVYGFAPLGKNEKGSINPFNDYRRTKYEAELIYT